MDRLSQYQSKGHDDDTVKVLRALLQHLPEDAKKNLVCTIGNPSITDDQLNKLPTSLAAGLLYALKNLRSWVLLEEKGDTKNSRLGRDDDKCLFTGRQDSHDIDENESQHCSLELARIWTVPSSGWVMGVDRESTICTYSLVHGKLWYSLDYCFPSLGSHIDNCTITDLTNSLTFDTKLSNLFNSFGLGLEATEARNTYFIRLYIPSYEVLALKPYLRGGIITFNDFGPCTPSAALIAIHAAIRRILSVTGKGDKFEMLRCRMEVFLAQLEEQD
ncbi:hypothetical protein N7508_008858 [Penicillium antarcticum]|uniref:uncharacterized protein n=1 Tax=Penicillium antarcticum TaxID=416450 RepID=UPI002385FAD2|nr:uncharacterized protein N7508_008858 [Penicillium antarcticum]KAJ5294037.1 hypothetical protein N7508_008858 [Penicillium antarcticum]